MQAQAQEAYEGYFDNGSFYVKGKAVRIPDHKMVSLRVMDNQPRVMSEEEKNERLACLARLEELIELSKDEDMMDFPHSDEMRPPLLFDDIDD